MRFSPSDLDVLIWHHTRPAVHPRIDAPAVQEGIIRFLKDGILATDNRPDGSGYQTTERGQKWLEMILSTPYPEHVWVDPRINTDDSPSEGYI